MPHDCGVKSVVCPQHRQGRVSGQCDGFEQGDDGARGGAFARNHPESATTVSVTRYGNVMYSRGSVIPLFRRAGARGPADDDHESRMTRFLMSLDESVALVQYAFENAAPGDLFIRKARPPRLRISRKRWRW